LTLTYLETLEQIVALKFLGIPLRQIGVVLKRAAHLPDALRLQARAPWFTTTAS
jgi:hypothetical protein